MFDMIIIKSIKLMIIILDYELILSGSESNWELKLADSYDKHNLDHRFVARVYQFGLDAAEFSFRF